MQVQPRMDATETPRPPCRQSAWQRGQGGLEFAVSLFVLVPMLIGLVWLIVMIHARIGLLQSANDCATVAMYPLVSGNVAQGRTAGTRVAQTYGLPTGGTVSGAGGYLTCSSRVGEVSPYTGIREEVVYTIWMPRQRYTSDWR